MSSSQVPCLLYRVKYSDVTTACDVHGHPNCRNMSIQRSTTGPELTPSLMCRLKVIRRLVHIIPLTRKKNQYSSTVFNGCAVLLKLLIHIHGFLCWIILKNVFFLHITIRVLSFGKREVCFPLLFLTFILIGSKVDHLNPSFSGDEH